MRKIWIVLLFTCVSLFLIGCEVKPIIKEDSQIDKIYQDYPNHDNYYHLFVRSFADSDGDGIGDIQGVTEQLDYLKDLGITAIWLLPIHPSPTYHGYDVTDYYTIHEDYGTITDFKNLIAEAKVKGIKIVMDLVINHTSDQHPWYVDANSSTSSAYRDWYYWVSQTQVFQSFVGGMMDLNLDYQPVVDEIKKIIDFYMDLGVHGFRLDAAQHFYLGNPGEKSFLTKNILFINQLNIHIKSKNPQGYLISEVFVNDYSIVGQYFSTSDSLFDFYLNNQIHQKIGARNNDYLFVNEVYKMMNSYRNNNPGFINATFLSNHDIDRVASMGQYQGADGFSRLKQAVQVLLTLPGNPFVYYGDELGMKGTRYEGDIISGRVVYDEYRRQPFLWGGSMQTTWLASDHSNDLTQNLEDQKNDEQSLYNHYKTLLNLRKDTPALRFGNTFLKYRENGINLQGYVRYIEHNGYRQALLIIHNISNQVQVIDENYVGVIYGNPTLNPFETVILEISFDQIGDYI